MSQKEVVIIGGGVLGCSTAYHLAKQGVPSQIIEMDAIAAKASGRAWAVISTYISIELCEGMGKPVVGPRTAPAYRRFMDETFKRMPQVARDLKEEGGIDIEYMELPALFVVFLESEEKFMKQRIRELRSEGGVISWLGADELRDIFPDLHPGARGAVYFAGGKLEPYKYTLALAQAAERKGASIKLGEAVGFRCEGTRVTAVTLATGTEVEADEVVLAMGPWLGKGTSWLGKAIDIKPNKLESLKLEMSEPFPLYRLMAGEIAILRQPDGTVLLGEGPMAEDMGVPTADGGVKTGFTFPFDWQPEFDDNPTERLKERYTEAAVIVLPRMEEAKLVEQRAGLLAMLPKHALLTLGRLPGWDNVYVTGAETAVMYSLTVGRLMAELIIKGRTEEDIEVLDPARLF
jgi:glycine oxidase